MISIKPAVTPFSLASEASSSRTENETSLKSTWSAPNDAVKMPGHFQNHIATQNNSATAPQNSSKYPNKKNFITGNGGTQNMVLKSSPDPWKFHIYVSNLDIGTNTENMKSFFHSKGVPMLHCSFMITQRVENPRNCTAHVIIDAKFKDKAFNQNFGQMISASDHG